MDRKRNRDRATQDTTRGVTRHSEQSLRMLALQLARRCRWIIQGCLREEEWIDADLEFAEVIFEGLSRVCGETT